MIRNFAAQEIAILSLIGAHVDDSLDTILLEQGGQIARKRQTAHAPCRNDFVTELLRQLCDDLFHGWPYTLTMLEGPIMRCTTLRVPDAVRLPLATESHDMEDRLIVLESKLAFAEDMLEALNLTIFRQQEQIDQLQQQLRLLYQQMQSVPAGEKANAREDVPPHY